MMRYAVVKNGGEPIPEPTSSIEFIDVAA